MAFELFIGDSAGEFMYSPAVEDGIEWSTERRGAPGKLTFKVINDGHLKFTEGSSVRLTMNGSPVFYGFVFTQKRDKNQIVTITAYDQLRYLGNKDTYVYENKTASQLIRMIASDFSLNTGSIEDTGFVIASRVEDNTSLFDMIGNALDLTMQNRRKMFVLYDDFGKLTLKNIASMAVGSGDTFLMIDEETGENFDYTSSIDNDTYNKVKLIYDNEETGKREVYIAQDGNHINNWGILQYFDTISKGENGQIKAETLLQLYNQKTRNLKITKAIGDLRVRGGSFVLVNLDLGDVHLKNFMVVENVKHVLKSNEHTMDLTLRGGEFIA